MELMLNVFAVGLFSIGWTAIYVPTALGMRYLMGVVGGRVAFLATALRRLGLAAFAIFVMAPQIPADAWQWSLSHGHAPWQAYVLIFIPLAVFCAWFVSAIIGMMIAENLAELVPFVRRLRTRVLA